MGNKTLYQYDPAGNMISQTDGNGNTRTYEYNCANLMIEKLDPADAGKPASKESYTYYANGLMRTRTDCNGV